MACTSLTALCRVSPPTPIPWPTKSSNWPNGSHFLDSTLQGDVQQTGQHCACGAFPCLAVLRITDSDGHLHTCQRVWQNVTFLFNLHICQLELEKKSPLWLLWMVFGWNLNFYWGTTRDIPLITACTSTSPCSMVPASSSTPPPSISNLYMPHTDTPLISSHLAQSFTRLVSC